ncbi:MAG: hypothetical protein ACRD6W_05005, partial [Nitrososphaerales archaeon]
YYSPGWIERWQQTHRGWLLAPGAATARVAPYDGAVLAFDPSASSPAVLFVRDDALWLTATPTSKPVRVAGPLLASTAPSGYYGEFDWSALFSWSSAPGPSEVASQAAIVVPYALEAVPNPQSPPPCGSTCRHP